MTESETLKWKRLGDVAAVNDRDHRTPKYLDAGVPLISPKDFTAFGIDFSKPKYVSEEEYNQFMRKCSPEKGDILYSRIGTIGEARQITISERFVALHSIAVIKPKRDVILPRYLLYALRTEQVKRQAKKGTKSIGTPDLGLKEIKNFEIPVPSLSIQKQIIDTLDRAERLKDLRQQANSEIDKYLQAAFLTIINNREYGADKIGNHVIKTETVDPKTNPNKSFRYVDIAGIENKKGIVQEYKTLLGRDAPSRARRLIRKDDIIVSTVRPNLNATAIVPKELDNEVCSTGFCVLRCDKSLNPRFLYAFTRTKHFVDMLSSKMKGASYPAVTNEDVLGVEIPVPPIKVQEVFAALFDAIISVNKNQEKSTQEINTLFDSLLQNSFAIAL
jgi:type I restriction enzyme S subunit